MYKYIWGPLLELLPPRDLTPDKRMKMRMRMYIYIYKSTYIYVYIHMFIHTLSLDIVHCRMQMGGPCN